MSARTRAEIAKLARLLGERPERFEYLADLPVDDLRVLRDRATDVLFDANRAIFERIAAASKLVPVAVTTAVAQKAFGPLLCARVAGVLEPDRAVDIAGRLPVEFLADVSVELDPRRAAAVLADLPADRVAAVGAELARRGDFVTMGRFVGTLPAGSLRATMAAIDGAAILRTAVYTEDDDSFAEVFAMVPDAKIPAILDALRDPDLAKDMAPVVAGLDDAGRARLAAALAEAPADLRATLQSGPLAPTLS